MIRIESLVRRSTRLKSVAAYNPVTNVSAPAFQPTSLAFLNGINTTMDVSWIAALGAPSGYLVVRVAAADLSALPVDNVPYIAGNTIGNGVVVYRGPLLACADAGLNFTANYFYKYYVFAYNEAGDAIAYLKTDPLIKTYPYYTYEALDAVNDFPTVFNDIYYISESFDALADLPLPLNDIYYISESLDA